MNIKHEYCGYITIIGKTNVGKSTILNQIIRKKISIVSRKKNTTQSNITGIRTDNHYQSIYIDTPGIILNKKNNQIQYKNNNSYKILKDSTLIMFIIDSMNWTKYDQTIFNQIKKNKIPIIIVINKIDKINNKSLLLPFIDFIKKKTNSIEIIPISAKKIKNIILLDKIIKSYLKIKPHVYPKDYITTNSYFFTISEIIREQLILFLGDELPALAKVEIEFFKKQETGNLYIRAIIWVKNIRHKAIVLGHNGQRIKKISIISRKNIEKEFYTNAHLFLWVKNKSLNKNHLINNINDL